MFPVSDQLPDFLHLCTGLKSIPVNGFDPSPSLDFIHETPDDYLQGLLQINMCISKLAIYVYKGTDYDDFKQVFTSLMKHGLFFSTP